MRYEVSALPGGSILIVDDEPDNPGAQLEESAYKWEGFAGVGAPETAGGRKRVVDLRQSTCGDLILLDLMMLPGLRRLQPIHTGFA